MTFRRREFLALPVALSAAAAVSDPWRNRPNRWGQLTLVEDDPPKYSKERGRRHALLAGSTWSRLLPVIALR